ncbi:MAG TPA: vWA domain-containing protein [Gaiellaceae bacterium]|nr:vWA domain-containing protein [Gaiellaceae bacterium]
MEAHASESRRRLRFRVWAPALAVLAASLIAVPLSASAGPRPLDVEIAIDTTGSMGPTIEQAKTDAKALVAKIKTFAPGSEFAVVQFKDAGDEVEYELVQPLTGNAAAIENAIGTLTAVGGGDAPEAYNLVFHNSVDSSYGWRANSYKLVVVLGDAEPHGAGTAGFAGCTDATADPDGYGTASELAAMKSAQRTLIMIRQVSTKTTASLECYQSLTAAGYAGGAAKNAGEDVGGVIEALVKKAVDTTAPSVRALPTSGKAGKAVALRYSASDDFGLTRERIAVYKGTRMLFTGLTKLTKKKPGAVSTFAWRPRTKIKGKLRFSVQSWDAAGHKSPVSWGVLTLR